MTRERYQRDRRVIGERRMAVRAWRDRVRDPGLSVLLVLELCAIFLATPLAAQGLPTARVVGETLVLAVVVIVVVLSHRRGAIAMILLGLAATLASLPFSPEVVPGRRERSRPRRKYPCLLGADMGGGACGLCSWPRHGSPPPRRRRPLSKSRNDLRFSLPPDLGAEPQRIRQPSRPNRRPQRNRHHDVFQPYHADHYRLRRHRTAEPIRSQHGEFGGDHRSALPRHDDRPPRDSANRGPAQMNPPPGAVEICARLDVQPARHRPGVLAHSMGEPENGQGF